MATSQGREDEALSKELKELISSLPREDGWFQPYMYQYQGFWYPSSYIKGAITFQKHFQARDNDILLISKPKSGSTWLKALVFAVVNRTRYSLAHHPLLNSNPHDLVPFFVYQNMVTEVANLPSPRLLATHMPYTSLSAATLIKESNCRIVYLCRNPGDTFISMWYFAKKTRPQSAGPPLSLEEAFEMFCSGASLMGPYWDHVLGYWNASLEMPERVLLLKYEELKQAPTFYLKRLAEFLGFPFSLEEEREGIVEEISKLCSFEKLSSLKVNQTGLASNGIEKKVFFRRGNVGDQANHLTPLMIERLNELTKQKFQGSGLSFHL